MPELVDQYGRPLRKAVLKKEVAGPTLAGVRQPISGYPGDGLTPPRLARILRSADEGEPMAYFELAEQVEERDLHYVGVLGTRKRAVSQVDVTVEAASDDAIDVAKADMVREWLGRDELARETVDMLDAIGKGYSWTEILWDTSESQYRPARLKRRDPRFFRFDRDGETSLLRGGIEGNGVDEPLPPFKFIELEMTAKSGLPIRSGLARLATWSWMFKAYTQRDWAIFTQTYGQPIRVGKYHRGATEDDRNTLFRAVANVAGDCAAIIPEGMTIDFVEADNLGAGSKLYEERCDWLDRQVSKAVLGQTNTTDAQAGGLGSGQANVHNDVREDIEKADCKALSAALNRDLVRPWCDLEYGPSDRYPRLVIARPEQEDLKLLSEALGPMIDRGLRVGQSTIRDKFGIEEPGANEDILRPQRDQAAPIAVSGETRAALQAQQREARTPDHPATVIARQMAERADPSIQAMAKTIELMMERASDLAELREMILTGFPEIDASDLSAVLEEGFIAASAAGRSDALDESA